MFFIAHHRAKVSQGETQGIFYTNLVLLGILPEVSACDCHPHVQQGLLADSFFKDRCIFDDATWLPGSPADRIDVSAKANKAGQPIALVCSLPC